MNLGTRAKGFSCTLDGITPWQSTAYTIYNEQGQPV
jgi:hypothetical protein